jgi:hypothetical protein
VTDASDHDAIERGGLSGDEPVARVAGTEYPSSVVNRDWWVTWILDGVGRKRPVAPWQSGHAYPVEWHADLDPADRPETSFREARRWAEFPLNDAGVSLPDDARSDDLRLGIILPADRPEREERITLIDWDDVRNPETDEIHPTAAEYIRRFGGFVEVSRSGKGLHQYVRGGLRKRGKFIAPIDSESFVGDDLPQVEIYDGGRHVAMTGDHVAGTDDDVINAQECIDELVTEYSDAEQDAGHRRYDPNSDGDAGDTTETEQDAGGHVPDPERGDYDGPSLSALHATKPDDRSFSYHAVVEAFYRGAGNASGYASVLNWRLEGCAAALGERDGLAVGEVLDDLSGEYLDDTDVDQGCRHETQHRVKYDFDRASEDRLAPPTRETLVEYGVLPPEAGAGAEGDGSGTESGGAEPLDAEAVFDPREAWRAAGAVARDDLNTDLPELDEAPDVVRAVAVAEGLVDDLAAASDLDPATYFDLYDRARTEYGAPLPIYVDATRTVDDLEATRPAVWNLQAGHILQDLDSDITVDNPNDDDVLAVINPTWEDSDSGERVIAFDGGEFYCRKHNQLIDPLRVVALEHGLIYAETAPLESRDYLEAYELARTEYGAPLPAVSWLDSDLTPDPDVEAVLPPADELVGEFVTDRDGLQAERDRVEDLYRELAADTTTDAVFSAEPSTGKSTAAVKTAPDEPTLLTSPRRELQKEYDEKASDPDIVGDSPPTTFIAPVFSEPWEGVSREAGEAGVAAVREVGFEVLQDSEALRKAAAERLSPEGSLEAPEADEDAVHLDRATCDTAAGAYGLEWALRVETAHQLGLEPRTIHERDCELFDEPIPCGEDHDDPQADAEDGSVCSYTKAYDYITDPEHPIDLLIGSRVHAKVDSAKTYHYTDDGTPAKRPRTVVFDEAVVGDYTTEWGENARHVATWIGRTLAAGVDDGTDLSRQADRLRDSWVGAWVRGDGELHLDDLRHRRTIGEALVTVARADDRHRSADQARALLLADGAVDTGDAVDVLRTLLDVPRHELDRYTIQALRRLDEGGALQAALDAVNTDTDLGAFDTPDPEPGAPFVNAARQPFDLLADGPDDDVETHFDRLGAAFDTAADLLEGGADGTRELVVRARDGFAHPQAYLLLAGALGGDDPVESHGAPIPGRDEPTRMNHVEVGQASVVYDRNGDGALLRTPPEYTDSDGVRCSVVGLDATPRRELWQQYAGFDDVEIVSPFDDLRERRGFVRDTRNVQVVQTDTQHVNTYSGDPTGKSFDEDLELLREVADTYGSQQLRRDSLSTTGDPAVITTKTVENYLGDGLEAHTSEVAHYWDVVGSNDLGEHKIGALLGAPHPGDDVIERAALLAGEEINPEGHGTEKDYNSPVANAMLDHAWKDQVTQAVHRFGRDEDGAVVFVHSAAVDDERLPVVGTGGVTTAWSDAGKAVRDALLPYLRTGGRFTVADIVNRVAFGRRTVQQKLGEFDRLGYVDREIGGPGRENVFAVTADPGPNGHADLGDADVDPVWVESEQSRNGIQYTGTFGLKDDLAPVETTAPPDRPTLPGPSAAAAGPPPDDPPS